MIDLVFRRRFITFGLTVNTERHLRGVRVQTDGSKLLKIQSDEVFGTDSSLERRSISPGLAEFSIGIMFPTEDGSCQI